MNGLKLFLNMVGYKQGNTFVYRFICNFGNH